MINWDAVTIESVRRDLDAEARRIFQSNTDPIAKHDRGRWGTFDQMPPGLQKWWRDRAERYDAINAAINIEIMRQ